MANLITGCRIFCSLVLLFTSTFSPIFYLLYFISGLSDLLDGMIARRMNTVSEFGSKLDSFADIVFVVICMIKICPVLVIPLWMWVWIGLIVIIKVCNLVFGLIFYHHFVCKHTLINKFTGFILFCLPFVLSFVDIKYSGSICCLISMIAAFHEGYLIWYDYRHLN
ncbi:MAG: CDP-alcohol phosphatidyltransferase family protein [Traorella sp.]